MIWGFAGTIKTLTCNRIDLGIVTLTQRQLSRTTWPDNLRQKRNWSPMTKIAIHVTYWQQNHVLFKSCKKGTWKCSLPFEFLWNAAAILLNRNGCTRQGRSKKKRNSKTNKNEDNFFFKTWCYLWVTLGFCHRWLILLLAWVDLGLVWLSCLWVTCIWVE